MSKHTKGPWAINEFLVYAENGNGCILATINSISKGISDEEAQANARLIAAAPDLLAACEWTAKGEHHSACKAQKGHKCNCYVGASQAAIEKIGSNR